MAAKILSRAYFQRPTLQVARGLLGKYLVRKNGSRTHTSRNIGVDDYVGPEDRACHASRGRTARTEVMFGPAGVAYVYLVYGMHHCFNIVTERVGYPSAVLVRAVENADTQALIDGPGRVCRFLVIDRTLNRSDLTIGERLWVEDRGERIAASTIAAYPRMRVDYAGKWSAMTSRLRLNNTGGKRQ